MAVTVHGGMDMRLDFLFIFSACLFLFAGFTGNYLIASDAAAEEIKADTVKNRNTVTPKPVLKEKKANSGRGQAVGGLDKLPTVITANSLTADNKAKTALFTGSVLARKGDAKFYADRMLVYYIETGDGENSNIDRIEATGNVKLVMNNRIITAGKAVYYAGKRERAVFSDRPRATENKNVLTGSVMTYYIKEDRSVVENSKIFIVEKDDGTLDRKKPDVKSADKGRKKK